MSGENTEGREDAKTVGLVVAGFVLLGAVMVGLSSVRHRLYWQCSPKETGMTRNGGIVSVCDGAHWVPVRVPVPR